MCFRFGTLIPTPILLVDRRPVEGVHDQSSTHVHTRYLYKSLATLLFLENLTRDDSEVNFHFCWKTSFLWMTFEKKKKKKRTEKKKKEIKDRPL